MSTDSATGGLHRLEQIPALRHRVHEQLETLILTGVFEPGARLVETDLAQTLGVSRGPIREALQLLARDGFVDLRPRQGAFVHVPTPKEVDDFFDVRRALEAESARLAAGRITPEAAERLRDALRRGRELLERGDDPSRQQPRTGIHQVILEVADNAVLEQMLTTLNKRVTWYLSPFDPSQRRRAWDEHEAIIEAIVAGDAEGAAQAMARHIHGSRRLYKSED